MEVNKILKQIPFEGERLIQNYIHQLELRYGVHINIDDIVGMSAVDYRLEAMIKGYSYHNNGFCNAVKKLDFGFCRCVENKRKTVEYAKTSKKPFYGRCYMGVEELIYPVLWKDKLIAAILVGQFTTNKARGIKRLQQQVEKLNTPIEELEREYIETIREIDDDLEALTYDIGLLVNYIIQVYSHGFKMKINKKDEAYDIEQLELANQNNFIVTNTIQFIMYNYNRDLSLQVLANNSYCNPTYLSHLFKERVGTGIVDYINEVRIEKAKYLLDVTDKSITEISILVGFNDPSYFAKVFKKLVGVSSKEYRQRVAR